jgi:SAM-dependent methyltransferase
MGLARTAVSRPDFWEGLYAGGEDGWELGAAAPPLARWLADGRRLRAARPDEGPTGAPGEPARIAVPGCGRGHDCRLLARHGYRVWGFDFAAAAIGEARTLALPEGLAVTYEQRDIFTLEADYRGFFDGVWEYTCFCAIDPARRAEYARLIHALLRPGGWLLACFYPLRDGADGPPFPVSRAEIDEVLAPHFRIVEAGPPAESAERRRGLEWLVLAERAERLGR